MINSIDRSKAEDQVITVINALSSRALVSLYNKEMKERISRIDDDTFNRSSEEADRYEIEDELANTITSMQNEDFQRVYDALLSRNTSTKAKAA